MNLWSGDPPLMPLGFWRGIYGFMCKTVWNLALSHGLNSRSPKWAQTSSRGKVKLYWNSLELGPNSILQNLVLNVLSLPYHWHGGNPSCVAGVRWIQEHFSGAPVRMVMVVVLEQECSELRSVTQRWHKSQCMDRSSPELLPAEEPGQASH